MKESKRIFCLWGYSGHAFVISESILRGGDEICGYFDLKESLKDPYKLKYLGASLEVDKLDLTLDPIVFPCVGNTEIRAEMVASIEKLGLRQDSIIDPTAVLSRLAKVGNLTFVGAGAIINPCANIGKGCIINTGAIIEHECVIGDYTHIAPGAVLAGNVQVGERSFVGANASVKQGVKIGSGVTVGAGAVVLCEITDGEVWVGNPAKKIR